ncbi:hypothetical protein HDV05_002142, partial [Chytridiales sp. JEL 0842]
VDVYRGLKIPYTDLSQLTGREQKQEFARSHDMFYGKAHRYDTIAVSGFGYSHDAPCGLKFYEFYRFLVALQVHVNGRIERVIVADKYNGQGTLGNTGLEILSLESIRRPLAISPDDVIRRCHLMPVFCNGECARDYGGYKQYVLNKYID